MPSSLLDRPVDSLGGGCATQAASSFRNTSSRCSPVGCNTGACHGAAGRQGRLQALAPRLRRRRRLRARSSASAQAAAIDLADPGRSLLILLKPLGAVPHKGGERFTTDSPEYQSCSPSGSPRGAPRPAKRRSAHRPLEIVPPQADAQARRDAASLSSRPTSATATARTSPAGRSTRRPTPSVATVDDDGRSVVGHGEGAVTAWYLSKIAIATITVAVCERPARRTSSPTARRAKLHRRARAARSSPSLNLPPRRAATTRSSSAAPSSTPSASCRRPTRSRSSSPTRRRTSATA